MAGAVEELQFLDAHIHANSRSSEDFRRLRLAGCRGAVAVAGAEAGFSSADSVLDFFRRLADIDRPRLEAASLRCFLALGVHPRGIPRRGAEELLAALPRAWREMQAAAAGELGLDTGSAEEIDVLRRQLALARDAGLPVLLHTPRKNKTEALRIILDLLNDFSFAPERALLDHLDEETLPRARMSGCWLGLSVHPAKWSPERAARLVAAEGAERIVLSTDLGAAPSYLFGITAAVAAMEEHQVPPDHIRRVVHQNALEFLEGRP